MRFTQEHQNFFKAISRDENPLHLDPLYACRTPFGEVVVYGVASVLYCLGLWSKGKAFQLREISAEFRKPLFLERDYEVVFQENKDQVIALIEQNGVVRTRIKFSADVSDSDFSQAGFPQIQKFFLLRDGQLPSSQLKTLLWTSYYVGMENPGKQALFSRLLIKFNSFSGSEISFNDIKTEKDERISSVKIQTHGPNVERLELEAFERPLPVDYSMEEISKVFSEHSRLQNKKIFVSGASRGFGAVLAKAFSLMGGELIIGYNKNEEQAKVVLNEIQKWNGKGKIFKGNLECSEDCERLKNIILNEWKYLDVFVANATAPIHGAKFLEQNSADFISTVVSSLKAFSYPLFQILPLMKEGSTVILVSTIYTVQPEKGFSHYVAAKRAMEGLMETLQLEYPKIHFKIFRPKRMLTDQTNTFYNIERPTSAVLEAQRMLSELSAIL